MFLFVELVLLWQPALHYSQGWQLLLLGERVQSLIETKNNFAFIRGTGPSQFYGEYTLCEKCMESMEGEVVIGDDPNQPQM